MIWRAGALDKFPLRTIPFPLKTDTVGFTPLTEWPDPMKIAYCGYDFFSACLTGLISRGFDVYRVFTYECDNRFTFNQYVLEIAGRHGIPLGKQPIDGEIIAGLADEGCNILITAGYQYKIPPLEGTGIKGINIHPSLLPIGRGVWPLTPTILTQQENTGVSIHKLTETFDAGDLLAQEKLSVSRDENLESLSCKVQILAARMLVDLMEDFEERWASARPQGPGGSYWPMPSLEDRSIQWTMNVAEISRISRACGKFGCFTRFNEKSWIVYDLTAWKETHEYEIGTVVHKTNTEMVVAASDGLVCLRYFEPSRA